MPALVTAPYTCPQCGKPVSGGLCAGACPECLANSMLGDWDDLDAVEEESSEPIITRIADYDVLRVLGRGGMGVVCRARDRLLGREVAMKLIHSGVLASDEELRRFRLEAEAVASLRHPHLIVVHEAGEADGQPYFTMTLAEGGTLANRLKIRGPMEPHVAAAMVRDIALAVQHAHSRGVLHRDLKPANIVFDADDQALVSDFGLARFTGKDSVTKSGALLGTPAYLAPEVASGSAGHTTSSDVYALGVMLYECLTGRPPFEAETPFALLKNITEREPPAPSALRAEVDHDLEAVCLRTLEKDPARRYASAEAFASDLARWLAGEPVTARHPPATERFWRWAQRNQSRAVLYSMAAVSVFFLVVLSAIMNVLLSTEKFRTEDAMHRGETRRAALLRDHAVQFMSREETLLRAVPHLQEASDLSTGDALQDHAIRMRQRVVKRLAPVLQAQWRTVTTLPILAWSQDSKMATCTDGTRVQAFDLAAGSEATAGEGAGLTRTTPAAPMEVPDDGSVVLGSLHSPDGQHVLVRSRGIVKLWSEPRPLPSWPVKGIGQAWFNDGGTLFTESGKGTFKLDAEGSWVTADGSQPATPDPIQALPLTATAEPNGLVHIWRGKPGDAEVSDPLPHPVAVVATAFDSTNRYLATLTRDQKLQVWEVGTGLIVTPPVPVKAGPGAQIIWDPSRYQLAVWDADEITLLDW